MSKKKRSKTVPTGKTGRPEIKDDQFRAWLDEMRPFLVLGCSLDRAILKSGLIKHRTTIYKKSKLGDWFTDEIDQLRSLPGENVNEAFARLISQILDKIKREEVLTRNEVDVLKHFSEKHRTAQPFFVSRTETAQAKDEDFGRIVERPTINVHVTPPEPEATPPKPGEAPPEPENEPNKEPKQESPPPGN